METKITNSRLFIAAWPDKNMQNALVKYMGACNQTIQGARWTEAANLHCTIAYLGDEKADSADDILRRMKSALEFIGPISIRWNGPGTFIKKETTVIWMGLEESPTLLEIAANIRSEFSELIDEKSFRPHITFGRTKRPIKMPISKAFPAWRPLSCTVDRIDLVASELTPQGPKYTILKSHTLGSDW
ncbi:MAG: RNA 2',3'-cyclic phosphodiesterase [Fibrobacteres bacterium]|nr:RNA 2',3'-cyclic phosphodiesterase [Fibrobacterota bacterium]